MDEEQRSARRQALEQLAAAHPLLFPALPERSWLPVGWYQLVHRLCIDIECELKGEPAQIEALGEKFGALKVSVRPIEAFRRVQPLVTEAREHSLVTCEYCGGLGTLRRVGGLKVLCDACQEALLERLEVMRSERE